MLLSALTLTCFTGCRKGTIDNSQSKIETSISENNVTDENKVIISDTSEETASYPFSGYYLNAEDTPYEGYDYASVISSTVDLDAFIEKYASYAEDDSWQTIYGDLTDDYFSEKAIICCIVPTTEEYADNAKIAHIYNDENGYLVLDVDAIYPEYENGEPVSTYTVFLFAEIDNSLITNSNGTYMTRYSTEDNPYPET